MNVFPAIQSRLNEWTTAPATAFSQVGLDASASRLRQHVSEAFSDPRIRVVVCGEFKSGKSTLIGAMLGHPTLLPTDINPCTSYITVVETGNEERYSVIRKSGTSEPLTREQFTAMTAESDADDSVDRIHVTTKSTWGADDAVIVDTPGLEDVTQTRSEVTLNYLPQADVIIVVLQGTQGVKRTVKDFVASYLTRHEQGRVVFVLNQKDHFNEEGELEAKLRACRAELKDIFPEPRIIPTNAISRDTATSGVAELQRIVADVVTGERVKMLTRRFVQSAISTLREGVGRLTTESDSLSVPIEEAVNAARQYELRIQEAEKTNKAAMEAAARDINESAETWARSTKKKLHKIADIVMAQTDKMTLDEIRDFIKQGRPENIVTRELRKILEDFADHMKTKVDASVSTLSAKVNVGSVVLHIPDFVYDLPMLLAPLFGKAGFLTKILKSLKLGGLAEKIFSFLGLNPLRTLAIGHLKSELESALDAVVPEIEAKVRDTSATTCRELIETALKSLREQHAAVVAGYADAIRRHQEEASTISQRKASISGALKVLGESESKLAAF